MQARERRVCSGRLMNDIDVWTFILFRQQTSKHTQLKFKQNYEMHKKRALY